MSHFLDRLTFFRKTVDTFADGHGIVTNEDRDWEGLLPGALAARQDRALDPWRELHRLVQLEDLRQGRDHHLGDAADRLPPHAAGSPQPRAARLFAGRELLLVHLQRQPAEIFRWCGAAWCATGARRARPCRRSPPGRRSSRTRRNAATTSACAGLGGFVRADWDEVNEIVAAANVYTVKTHGPDRVIGFSPIPAMSMVSYAAGSRYLSLIGGVCMSFYDWYCDLPPSSPQTWGEQTDVPESADWYNSTFLMMWGSNVPQTRTPDAHFMTEVRYKGATTVTVTPDYSEASKFADIWLNPKQGTDAALALAMGHVILKEWHLEGRSAYFEDYCRRYTDMPLLVTLRETDGGYVPDRMLRAADLPGALEQTNNPEWKTVAIDETRGDAPVCPVGSIGFRWGETGKWNIEEKDGGDGEATRCGSA